MESWQRVRAFCHFHYDFPFPSRSIHTTCYIKFTFPRLDINHFVSFLTSRPSFLGSHKASESPYTPSCWGSAVASASGNRIPTLVLEYAVNAF